MKLSPRTPAQKAAIARRAAAAKRRQLTEARMLAAIKAMAKRATPTAVARLQAAIGNYIDARNGRPLQKAYQAKVVRAVKSGSAPKARKKAASARKPRTPYKPVSPAPSKKATGILQSIFAWFSPAPEPTAPEPTAPDTTAAEYQDAISADYRRQELDNIDRMIRSFSSGRSLDIDLQPWDGDPREGVLCSDLLQGNTAVDYVGQLAELAEYARQRVVAAGFASRLSHTAFTWHLVTEQYGYTMDAYAGNNVFAQGQVSYPTTAKFGTRNLQNTSAIVRRSTIYPVLVIRFYEPSDNL